MLNFMLIGMSFSAVFANMIPEEKLNDMMKVMNPVIGFGMIVVILNLAAPLDFHLIFGAGIYTAVYIVARAVGKYSGAYFGASITHAPAAVINEIIAVFMAKKGFEWAGELHQAKGGSST